MSVHDSRKCHGERRVDREARCVVCPSCHSLETMEPEGLMTVVTTNGGSVPRAEPDGHHCEEILRRFSILNVSSDLGTTSLSTLTPDTSNPRARKLQRQWTPTPERARSSSSESSGSRSSNASKDEPCLENDIRQPSSSLGNESVRPEEEQRNTKLRPMVKISKEYEGKPQQLLYVWFGKNESRSIGKDCYVVDDSKGPDHQKQFTAFFIHPKTFEVFPSGRFLLPEQKDSQKPEQYEVDPVTGLVWYKTKKLAMGGAAARAYDCLSHRKGLESEEDYEQIGEDPPSILPIPLSDKTSKSILDEILAKKGQIVMKEQRLPSQNAADDHILLQSLLGGTFFDQC